MKGKGLFTKSKPQVEYSKAIYIHCVNWIHFWLTCLNFLQRPYPTCLSNKSNGAKWKPGNVFVTLLSCKSASASYLLIVCILPTHCLVICSLPVHHLAASLSLGYLFADLCIPVYPSSSLSLHGSDSPLCTQSWMTWSFLQICTSPGLRLVCAYLLQLQDCTFLQIYTSPRWTPIGVCAFLTQLCGYTSLFIWTRRHLCPSMLRCPLSSLPGSLR